MYKKLALATYKFIYVHYISSKVCANFCWLTLVDFFSSKAGRCLAKIYFRLAISLFPAN